MKVTEEAWKEIIRQDAGKHRWVQFFVHGGGCNGFQYYMGWMDPMIAFTNDNHLLEPPPVQVDGQWVFRKAWIFVDPKSYKLVGEMTLDFKPLKGFIFDNPKVTSSCGCGKSISF
jgi:iron-sulfur cluster assembly accessory protein